jgi:plastocyanin
VSFVRFVVDSPVVRDSLRGTVRISPLQQTSAKSIVPARGRYRARNGLSVAVTLYATLTTACGSYGGPSPSPVLAPTAVPSPAPSSPPSTSTVAITPSGMTPSEVMIGVGGRVMFVNNDNIPHDIQGGPDPEHRDCLEIDAVGFLTPGQSKQTNPLTIVRTCDYHDHSFHATNFNGRIVIR